MEKHIFSQTTTPLPRAFGRGRRLSKQIDDRFSLPIQTEQGFMNDPDGEPVIPSHGVYRIHGRGSRRRAEDEPTTILWAEAGRSDFTQ